MVATQIFLILTPNFGEDEPNLTVAYFSDGLVQPPTRKKWQGKTRCFGDKTCRMDLFRDDLFGWCRLFFVVFVDFLGRMDSSRFGRTWQNDIAELYCERFSTMKRRKCQTALDGNKSVVCMKHYQLLFGGWEGKPGIQEV